MLVDTDHAEAVLFFDKGKIIKEVLYVEFQAILDNYVPMQDIADREMKAVYVRIDHHFQVTSAVFFRIELDKEGFIVKSWNLPLQHLADNAASGPDMGSGPIKLSCYSQCGIEWHQRSLWDPVMKSGINDFSIIKKSIKNNNLGIIFKVDSIQAKGLPEEYSESLDRLRIRSARKIREYRLRMTLLENKYKQEIKLLKQDHLQRLEDNEKDHREHLSALEATNTELHTASAELQEAFDGQADKMVGMREYFEHKLEIIESNEKSGLDAMEAHYEAELEARLEAAVSDIKAEVQAKDDEVLQHKEREMKLQQDVIQLQKNQQELQHSSGGAMLGQLSAAGVNLVIYHPGAGHLTIPYEDVGKYLENTPAFVAKSCGLTESLYRSWLEHFYSPTCQHELGDDEFCDYPVERLEEPHDFIAGESNRCSAHRHYKSSVIHLKDHELKKSS